jgi:hypothetical protein
VTSLDSHYVQNNDIGQKTANMQPMGPRNTWKDDNEMDFGDIWFQGVNLIQLAQKRV